MSIEFVVWKRPEKQVFESLGALYPENPYLRMEFAQARARLGNSPWVLGLTDSGRLVSGCVAFLKTRYLVNRTLEIPSINEPATPVFWAGLVAFCRKQHISYLEIDSYGSRPFHLPDLPGLMSRGPRTEYVLDLSLDLFGALDSKHKQSLKKALASGLSVERSADPATAAGHARLFAASLDRRRRRGETVTIPQPSLYAALVENGAGEFFQARKDGELLSSVLVLRSATGAYYYSAGNHPEALRYSASHLLVYEICRAMKQEGMSQFNFGQAAEEGLARFKRRFGSEPVPLEFGRYFFGSRLRKHLGTARRLLITDPRGLFRAIGRGLAWSLYPVTDRLWLRSIPKRIGDHVYDCIHRVDTAGRIGLENLKIAGPSLALGSRYQTSSTAELRRLLAGISVRHEDFVFIDFGSGKGKCLLLAADYPFQKVIGVEFSPELAGIAQRNIERYRPRRRRCRNLEAVLADATEYPLPPDPGIYFFYNPFQSPVMELVLRNIRLSLEEHPRPVYIIYHNPVHASLLDACSWLRRIRQTPASLVYQNV